MTVRTHWLQGRLAAGAWQRWRHARRYESWIALCDRCDQVALDELGRAEPQVAALAPTDVEVAGDEDLTTATPGIDRGKGVFSDRTLVARRQSANLALIGSPQANFFSHAADPDDFTLVESCRQNLRATNDTFPTSSLAEAAMAASYLPSGSDGPRGEESRGDNRGNRGAPRGVASVMQPSARNRRVSDICSRPWMECHHLSSSP